MTLASGVGNLANHVGPVTPGKMAESLRYVCALLTCEASHASTYLLKGCFEDEMT